METKSEDRSIRFMIIMVLSVTCFNAIMTIFTTSERNSVLQRIEVIEALQLKSDADRELIKSKLYSDLTEIKAVLKGAIK